MTGADLESVCKKATLLAIAEFHKGPREATFSVCQADFVNVLATAGLRLT